jgi:hypothetical protein
MSQILLLGLLAAFLAIGVFTRRFSKATRLTMLAVITAVVGYVCLAKA